MGVDVDLLHQEEDHLLGGDHQWVEGDHLHLEEGVTAEGEALQEDPEIHQQDHHVEVDLEAQLNVGDIHHLVARILQANYLGNLFPCIMRNKHHDGKFEIVSS